MRPYRETDEEVAAGAPDLQRVAAGVEQLEAPPHEPVPESPVGAAGALVVGGATAVRAAEGDLARADLAAHPDLRGPNSTL
jgi:hypothetical protein